MGFYFFTEAHLARMIRKNRCRPGFFNLIQIRMDKEKILPKLSQMLGKTSLSDKTINDYATSIASLLTDDAQLTEEFYTAHVNILKSMDGNFSHDVAAQVDEIKKNLPTPQTPPATPQVNPQTEEKPQWAKDIEDKFQALQESQQKAQKHALQTQLIESVRKRATNKDASDEKSGWAANAGVLNSAISLIQIEDTDTPETVEQKCREKYNAMCVEIFGSLNAVPGAGSGESENGTAWIADEKKRLQESGRLPKD